MLTATKLNPEHLQKVAKKHKVPAEGGWTPTELATSLAAKLAGLYPNDEVLECTVCGFPSPGTKDLTHCPGCAAKFEFDDEELAEQAAAKSAKAEKKAKGAAAKLAVVGTDGGPVIDVGAGADKGKVEPTTNPGEVAARLAALTTEVRSLRDNLAKNGWEIGRRLLEIHDKNLWAGKFDSFADYVEKQCGFSRTAGVDFIRVARAYPDEKSIAGLTISHLKLLAKIPDPEIRAKLTEEAKVEKPSKAALANKVHEQRKADFAAKKANGEKVSERERPERRGHENKVVVKATLDMGTVVFEGKWTNWDRGAGQGRFRIGDAKFVVEVLPRGEGFKIHCPKQKVD